MTPTRDWYGKRSATLVTAIALMMIATAIPLALPPAAAVSEYRFELVVTPPTPLDYKGVCWSPGGTEATVVGGVNAVLAYNPETGTARSITSGNGSSASQLLESVTYTPWSAPIVSGGRLEESRVMGDVWEVSGNALVRRASVEGTVLEAVAASPTGRILAIGALGTVHELVNGSLVELGRVGDVVLHDLAWAPDGSGALIVGAAGSMTWFDAASGALEAVDFTSTHPIYSCDWRPGTDTAWAVGEGGLVVEFNLTTMGTSRVRPYTPRTEDSFGVAWHPQGHLALLVGEEGVTYIWRMGVFTRQVVDTKKYLLDVMWDPVGDEALVVGESGTLLRFSSRIPTQNRAPEAVITSPSDGLVVEEGIAIDFDGSGSSDPDGDELAFTWTSNASGVLGDRATFTRTLPRGSHLVTLWVDDGAGHNTSDQAVVSVVRPVPKEERLHVAFTFPRAGAVLSGQVVVTGTAHYELGPLASVELSVDHEGWRPAEGTTSWSVPLDTSILAEGAHQLAARATAGDGVQREATILVEVRNQVDPGPTEIPNITLSIRERGTVDEVLAFEVTGEDLSMWDLRWSFGDGHGGHGPLVRHAYSEKGRYQVTLELWLAGADEPATTFTATVVITEPQASGGSMEARLVAVLVIAAVVYVVGFYGGQRARHRRERS